MKTNLPWNGALVAKDMVATKAWAQKDLARAAGLNEHTVMRVLAGQPVLTRSMIKVAKALGRPLRRYWVEPT